MDGFTVEELMLISRLRSLNEHEAEYAIGLLDYGYGDYLLSIIGIPADFDTDLEPFIGIEAFIPQEAYNLPLAG
jgi:hypothetical protein